MNRLFSTTLLFYLFSFISYSQETDDLYFNKNDRKKSVVKNKGITAADVILQNYRKKTNSVNNESITNLDENILNKYQNNISNVDDKKLAIIKKSLKYNRDNLFVRPVNNNSFKKLRNYSNYSNYMSLLNNSFSHGYYDPFAYERLINGYYSNWNLSNVFWNKTKWWMMVGTPFYAASPLIIFTDPFYSMIYGNGMMYSPIDYWAYGGFGYNSICVIGPYYQNGYSLYSGFNNYYNINNTYNVVNVVKKSKSSNMFRGPRISRGSGSLNSDNIESLIGRRPIDQSGRVKGRNIDHKGSNSQNEYLRSRINNAQGRSVSRTELRDGFKNQYARNRSMTLDNRNFVRKISRIYSNYDQNDSRSGINRGSGFENSNYAPSRGRSIQSSDTGRRDRYNFSSSQESYGGKSSFYNRSSSSSNYGGRSSFSTYSSGGTSSSGNYSTGGSSSKVSSSKGGSSRGGVN